MTTHKGCSSDSRRTEAFDRSGRDVGVVGAGFVTRRVRGSGASSTLVQWSAVLVLSVALLLVLASVASAAPKSVSGLIGGPTGGGAGEFEQPRDVALYEGTDSNPATDKIFVVEASGGKMRVQRLDRDGNFEQMWGRAVDTSQPGTGYEVCVEAAVCQAPALSSMGAGALKGEFDDPTGVAVDQTNGWVYVYDRDNKRVQKFGLDGSFILMFGDGVNATTGGDVCTEVSADVCRAGTGGVAAGQIGPVGMTGSQVRGLAVDPTTSDVFVADPSNRRVQQFDAAGGFLRGWGWDVDKTTVDNRFEVCTTNCGAGANSSPANANGAFAASNPLHLAVDSNGIVYASDTAPTTSTQRVIRFDTSPPPVAPGDATSALAAAVASPPLVSAGTTPTVGLEIDPDSDGGGADEEHLLVARDPATSGQNTVVQEFDIPATPTDPILAAQLVDTHIYGVNAAVSGIGVSAGTGNIYLAVAQLPAPGHGLIVLNSVSGSPVPVAQPPSPLGPTTATLRGTVNPGGGEGPVTYRFEISSDGSVYTPVPGDSPPYLSGSSPVAVSQPVAGLDPNTFYRVRIVATRVTGPATSDVVTSFEEIFLTDSVPPEVVTLPIGPRTDTTAELRATVDPNGSATNYYFEYGGDATYGTRIPLNPAPAGSGNEPLAVSEQISNLIPDTTYHYRIVADGFGAPVEGADQSFTTQPVPGPEAPVGDRAYELVSPPDKVGGSGLGPWYGGVGSHANTGVPAYEGDRFASSSTFGASLVDGGFSYATDWALGDRTPVGWVNRPAFNRPGGFGSSEFAKLPYLHSFSDDLALTSWGSNSVIRIFAEQAEEFGAFLTDGQAVREWDSGRWEIVAPLEPEQQIGGLGAVRAVRVAADGGYVLASGTLRGVAGLQDPTHYSYTGGFSDLVCPDAGTCNSSVYTDDVAAGVSDSFPGAGVRSLVNVCTGTGASRTAVPSVIAGKIVAEACPIAPAGRPSARLISTRGASLATGGFLSGHLSDDGSRIFFMSPDHTQSANTDPGCAGSGAADTACPPQIYVRQRNSDGSVTTRWISQSTVSGQDASLMATAVFEGASTDGDKVFFRTASPLTADDPNGGGQVAGGVKTGAPDPNSFDLYMYDLPDGPDGDPSTPDGDPAGGALTRISAGPQGNADGNATVEDGSPSTDDSSAVRGVLRAVGDDGSRAYFTTSAPLAGVPVPGSGTITAPGGTVDQIATKNLYLYDANRPSGQRWRFIANLPATSLLGRCAGVGSAPEGDGLLAGGNGNGIDGTVMVDVPSSNCVRDTGDGSFVTFLTDGRLTADDPDSVTGDVYAYDADADALTRLSASQGGAGGSYVCITSTQAGQVPGTRCHGDPIIDGNFSAAPLNVVTNPSVPGDRTAFFESGVRLVAEDRNAVYDVYQWRNGKLSLVSTGAPDAEPALYRGNDRTGTNVYISTRDRLTWQDHDSALDVYVARVGGGIPQPTAPPVCSLLADGCQQGPSVGAVSGDAQTAKPGGGEAVSRPRMRLAIARPSDRALRRAARRGVVAVRVRAGAAGSTRVVARARIAGRTRRVGASRMTFVEPGSKTVRVRLSASARRRLSAAGRLSVRLTVAAPGARAQSLSIVLRRAGR
jgi:NHL repeat